jgi:hypothetical protein
LSRLQRWRFHANQAGGQISEKALHGIASELTADNHATGLMVDKVASRSVF